MDHTALILNNQQQSNHSPNRTLVGRDALFLIHYWWPVLLGWSLTQVIEHAEGTLLSHAGLALLLSGIGAAYSLDRLIDTAPDEKKTPWLQGMLWGAFLGCSLMILLLMSVGKISPAILAVAALLCVMCVLYPQLKRIPLLKTAVVAVAWVGACSTLPFNRVSISSEYLLNVQLPLLLLVAAGCILCDLKDAGEDRERNVLSLPLLFGTRSSCFMVTTMALLAALQTVCHHHVGIACGALLLALVAQFPSLLAKNPLGPLLVDLILTLPGVLVTTGAV